MVTLRSRLLVGGVVIVALLFVATAGVWLMMSTVIAENDRHSSVTGFFGLDEDGIPVVDRHGIMLVFDGDIAGKTVSVDTFEVSLNDGSLAEVVETRVDGAYVFFEARRRVGF